MSGSQRRAVAGALRGWGDAGRPAVLATVVTTSDSAPRGLGAQLAVTGDDLWVGGLTGGCAEVAVLAEAHTLLRQSGPFATTLANHITMTRDLLGSVGPVCGATLGVLIERVDEDLVAHLDAILAAGAEGKWALAERTYVPAGDGERMRRVEPSLVLAGETPDASSPHGSVAWRLAANRSWLLGEAIAPAPRLVIGGAGDVAVETIRLAQQLGWRTALVDPRTAFVAQTLTQVTPDIVLREWPESGLADLQLSADTACLALAHDQKLDMPFLTAALRSDAFYVGSVGSRVVQHDRSAELIELVGEQLAARHRGPAGLNLGGSTAADIALSILAEAVATWNGRSGAPLRESREPIRAH